MCLSRKTIAEKYMGVIKIKDGTIYKWKKFNFYNPVAQNDTHIKALIRTFNLENPSFVFSYIVFSNRSELKKISISKPDVTLLQTRQLVRTITQDEKSREKIFSKEIIDLTYKKIKDFC